MAGPTASEEGTQYVGETIRTKPAMNWGKEAALIFFTCGLWAPVTFIKWILR